MSNSQDRAIKKIQQKTEKNPLSVLRQAIRRVTPNVTVKARRVERRQEGILKSQGSNLYVKNIDDAIDDDELRSVFSHCGTITSAKIMWDEKGLSRGFGFVCFTSPEEANKALADLSGYMLHGKPLYVAIAQHREVRRMQLQARFDCRHFHNEAKNSMDVDPLDRHDVPRHEVRKVICSLCRTGQDVQQICVICGVCMGKYFCEKCNFFDNEDSKQQQHCDR